MDRSAQLVLTPFGRPAYEALTRAVAAAKDGDPLRPVHLIVPSEPVGVAARRWLARSTGDGTAGIAGLPVFTLRRLAETIATPIMAREGRRPVTPAVHVGAMRGALASDPGVFAHAAEHPYTASALTEASRALRPIDDETLDRFAAQRAITADVVRIHRRVTTTLMTQFYDEEELLTVAASLLQRTDLPDSIIFLPGDLAPAEQTLVAALARCSAVTAIAAVTGSAGDDRVVGSIAAALGAPAPAAASAAAALGHEVLSTPDPDDEITAVVALVGQALAAGTPGHQIAVVYPSASPYPRIIHEQMDAAGIAQYGRGVKPAAERRYGRAIRALLELPERDFRRAEVMAWLADAPVDAPAAKWDRISRAAGVVSGSDWERRLEAYRHSERARADEADAAGNGDSADWSRADAAAAGDLAAFMSALRSDLAAIAAATTWDVLSDRLAGLWARLLPLTLKAPEEVKVHERITSFLNALGRLEGAAGPASLMAAQEMLELELRNDLDRVGEIGKGVMVGSIADAAGLEWQLLFVVGMAEGKLPAVAADDPLLPESVRISSGGLLPTWRERQDAQHRTLLAAIAGADRCVLSYPRGDTRSSATHIPSRWLLPTLQAMLGGDFQATDKLGAHPSILFRRSAAEALLSARPIHQAQYAQRHALSDPAAVDPIAGQMAADRAEGAFSRFTGFVGTSVPLPEIGPSPTALQAWFACPHNYFLRHVLKVRPLEEPDEAIEMSALDQGTLLHKVLEDLVRCWPDPGYGEPWPPDLVQRLEVLIDAQFAHEERHGIVGLRSPWENTKRKLRRDLRSWIGLDNALRSGRWKPIAPELAFAGLAVELPDGTTIALRGSADRVDADADGNLRVLDYKSGKSDKYTGLSAEDPTKRGAFLQLPLYALAAERAHGRGPQPTAALFWFISEAEKGRTIGYDVTDDVRRKAVQTIAVAVHGHRSGLFPPRPVEHSGAYECPACSPDGLGERQSASGFEALLADPRLAEYREVLS